MSGIDPALLQAQWLQYQQGQLAQSATIPQYPPQYQQQYAPTQSVGEFVSAETIDALAQFFKSANSTSNAAAEYISYLQNELASLGIEYSRLTNWSLDQNELIEKFLFNRDFGLQYARYAWVQNPVTDEFMSRFAEMYLETAELSPRGVSGDRNPEYTGNPNIQFAAQAVPQNPVPQNPVPQNPVPQQNLIPPLPSSNGNASPYITMQQYLVAQQQGQVAQARAAALQNPAGLYGALFQ